MGFGNGLNTWIFKDPWVSNEPNFIPQLRSGASNEDNLVADLIDQDTRQWDKGKLSYLFDQATMNIILNILLTQQFQHD